jgi:hypothetical protein
MGELIQGLGKLAPELTRFLPKDTQFFLLGLITLAFVFFGIFILIASVLKPNSPILHKLHSRVWGANSTYSLRSLRIGAAVISIASFIGLGFIPETDSMRVSRLERERQEAQQIETQKAEESRKLQEEAKAQEEEAKAQELEQQKSLSSSSSGGSEYSANAKIDKFLSDCEFNVAMRHTAKSGLLRQPDDVRVVSVEGPRSFEGGGFSWTVRAVRDDGATRDAICTQGPNESQASVSMSP